MTLPVRPVDMRFDHAVSRRPFDAILEEDSPSEGL